MVEMTSLCARSEHVSVSRRPVSTPPCPKVRLVRRVASCKTGVRKTAAPPSSSGKRRVTFSEEIGTLNVVRRCDLVDEDFERIWYCKEDFKTMKRMYLPTLKKMAKGIALNDDEESRGLEHKTPVGNKRRHKNRLVSIDSVIREQDRQWDRNILDAEFISVLYIQASAHCILQASLVAKGDEEYVNKYVKGLGLPAISEAEDDDEYRIEEEPHSDSSESTEIEVHQAKASRSDCSEGQVQDYGTHILVDTKS